MAQVTCNIVEPKQTRPNEGSLMINIEFNHVACPGFEPGRLSRYGKLHTVASDLFDYN